MHDAFWEKLLPLTIANAIQNTVFYRELYADQELGSAFSVADLPSLPIVTRAMLQKAGYASVARNLTCAAIQNTSGTSGPAIFLHRSVEEFAFIEEFFSRAFPTPANSAARPLVLNLSTIGHGVHTPVPSPVFVLQSDLISLYQIHRPLAYLAKDYELEGVVPRVSSVVGTVSQLNVLTHYLCEHGLKELMEPIREIFLTSEYVTPANRAWLQQQWGGIEIHNRYSMSECFGGATYCKRCHGFHFDPMVVPELVEYGSDENSETPLGRLLVTALFPFVRMQPIIRYQSDDIFSIKQANCSRPSFQYFGRTSQTLFDPLNGKVVVLPGTTLDDVLDETVDVARTPTFEGSLVAPFAGEPIVMGYVGMEAGLRRFDLVVAMTQISHNGKQAQDIEEKLLERCPVLQRLVSLGEARFAVTVVHENSIDRSAFNKRTGIWVEQRS
ncbi:hypothetical protein ACCS70_29370 [Rhizobium ruizarguesonis]